MPSYEGTNRKYWSKFPKDRIATGLRYGTHLRPLLVKHMLHLAPILRHLLQ